MINTSVWTLFFQFVYDRLEIRGNLIDIKILNLYNDQYNWIIILFKQK